MWLLAAGEFLMTFQGFAKCVYLLRDQGMFSECVNKKDFTVSGSLRLSQMNQKS